MEEVCTFNVKIAKFEHPYRIVLASALMVVAIPIVVLNFLVISAIWKTAALHKPSKYILANLALTDFFVGSIICPFTALENIILDNRWIHFYCYVWPIATPLVFSVVGVNLYILTAMSVDRFLAIRMKLSYRNIVTHKRVIAVMVFGWTSFFTQSLVASTFLFRDIPVEIFISVTIAMATILLSTLVIFTFLSFYYLKKYTSQTHNSNQQLPNTSSPFDVRSYRRTYHTMLIVLLAISFSFLPFIGVAVLNKLAKASEKFGYLRQLAWLIVLMNSAINPMLYLWRMKDLRQAVNAVLRRQQRIEP